MWVHRVHYNIFSLILIRHDGQVAITGCGCLDDIEDAEIRAGMM
jgi:hypothetical protein